MPDDPAAGFHYLLGDSSRESDRLDAQAELWDPVSHALFDRLGVRPGWRILEIGPGSGSLHRELRRRVHGAIDAVEQSHAFAAALARRCAQDDLGPGRLFTSTLADTPLPDAHYDLIFARWVFLFLPDPLAHVHQLARALAPGGLLAIQDYFRDTFCLVPRPADWSALVAADLAFFASQGGDANIGTRLPHLFEDAGLELVETVPTTKSGHPGSAVWRWLSTYFLDILDAYTAFPPFTTAAAVRIRDAWQAAAARPASLLIAPTVLDVVGRRPPAR